MKAKDTQPGNLLISAGYVSFYSAIRIPHPLFRPADPRPDSEVAKVANFFHTTLGDVANFFGEVANLFGDLASFGWRGRQLFLATSPSEKLHKANVSFS